MIEISFDTLGALLMIVFGAGSFLTWWIHESSKS